MPSPWIKVASHLSVPLESPVTVNVHLPAGFPAGVSEPEVVAFVVGVGVAEPLDGVASFLPPHAINNAHTTPNRFIIIMSLSGPDDLRTNLATRRYVNVPQYMDPALAMLAITV